MSSWYRSSAASWEGKGKGGVGKGKGGGKGKGDSGKGKSGGKGYAGKGYAADKWNTWERPAEDWEYPQPSAAEIQQEINHMKSVIDLKRWDLRATLVCCLCILWFFIWCWRAWKKCYSGQKMLIDPRYSLHLQRVSLEGQARKIWGMTPGAKK